MTGNSPHTLCDPVGRFKNRGFGQVIRQRRHQLDLTQEQVARRIKISATFVAALEKGRRRPSDQTIVRLANLLGLDVRQLFFLVHPRVHAMFGPAPNEQVLSAWEQFRNNDQLLRAHKVTEREMAMLSAVASLGEVPSPHEFIYVLNAVRQSLRC